MHFQSVSGIVTLWSIEFRVPFEGSKGYEAPYPDEASTYGFSSVSTGDSDMPSSCEINNEPEFKPLQGNRAFFLVRASPGPFHLRQKTQGPSHIPIAEGKLLLRCLWKVGSHLQSKLGYQLSSWGDIGCLELSSSCCTDINIHIDLTLVSQGISVVS